jgi:acyl-coenzyme A thioesterase PaaI-like protein
MKGKVSELVDFLLRNSHKKIYLKMSEILLHIGIPFNIPHHFRFMDLSANRSVLKLPLKWKNKNHLGGAHACAIATLGEFTAGLLLTRALGSSTYRIIMTDLYVDYLKQGRTHLYGTALITDQEINIITRNAEENGVVTHKMQTEVKDEKQEKVAVVTTTWQFKDWSQTSFK